MNERGIASLTAMIILLMLAYSIRGTNFTAGNLVDMTRNFEVENQLQLAAESAFNKEIEIYNEKSVEDAEILFSMKSYPHGSTNLPENVDDVIIDAQLTDKSIDSQTERVIIIFAVAKKINYIGGTMNAYRSVSGFLIKTPKTEGEPPTPIDPPEYIYKFKGYLHKTI